MRTGLLKFPFLLLFSAAAASAADPPGGIPNWPGDYAFTVPADAAKLAADLASADFATREQASQALAAMGSAGIGLLQQLAREGDPEVRSRAESLLATGPMPPVMPTRLAKLKGRYTSDTPPSGYAGGEIWPEVPHPEALYERSNSYLPSDLDAGTEAGRLFLQIARAKPTEAATIQKMFEGGAPEEWILLEVREAIASGDLDKAEGLLRQEMGSPHKGREAAPRLRADYAALVALRRGKAFDPQKELDALHIGAGNRLYTNEMGRLLFRAAGDYQGAARFGSLSESDGNDFASAMQEAGLLKELADLRQADAARRARSAPQRVLPAATIASNALMNDQIEEAEKTLQEAGDAAQLRLLYTVQFRLKDAAALGAVDPKSNYGRQVIRQLARMGFTKTAREMNGGEDPLAQKPMDNSAGGYTFYADINNPEPTVAVNIASDFWVWWSFYPETADASVRMDRYHLATSSKVSPEDARKLADIAIKATAGPKLNQQRANMEAAVNTLCRLGYPTEAARIATAWTDRENDGWGQVMLGDLALDRGAFGEAYEHYLKGAPLNRTHPGLFYRAAFALAKVPGKKEQADQMMAWVPLLAMASGIDAVTEAKTRLEGQTTALGWADQAHRTFGPAYVDARSRYDREANRAAAAGRWIEAENWQKIAIAHGGDLAQKQRYFHALVAQEAVSRGDIPAALAALQRQALYGEPDVPLLEKLLPAVAAKDPDAARKLVAAASQSLADAVTLYPGEGDYAEKLRRLEKMSL